MCKTNDALVFYALLLGSGTYIFIFFSEGVELLFYFTFNIIYIIHVPLRFKEHIGYKKITEKICSQRYHTNTIKYYNRKSSF